MGGNWFTQSIVGLVFLTPAWLAIPFFEKNYGVPGNVFMVWYFLGCSIIVAAFGVPTWSALVPSVPLVVALLLIGLTIGGIANMALFTAVTNAPNPGLPVAIANVASVTTFLLAGLLAQLAPAYFAQVRVDLQSFAGIVLVIVGAALISIR